MKTLVVSDEMERTLFSEQTPHLFKDIDLIISCGDLPYYYLEYIEDAINAPLLFVHGNHDPIVEYWERGERTSPMGAVNLHQKVISFNKFIFAGFEGSIKYRNSDRMYTQMQMWIKVIKIIPFLLWNKLMHGRFLDVLVTHAPPAGIHELKDFPHTGFKAFRWIIETFKPAIHFHGHVGNFFQRNNETIFSDTCIINIYGHKVVQIDTKRMMNSERVL